ncbi:EAL domain-containing protein [Agarivorans sp. Z349TD_8]|uniref:EAL domain-containing protein n=1 Tax=Agarivorans sp. Z349TD_8 TaxID=3421434 RepID=UPI003D7D37C4
MMVVDDVLFQKVKDFSPQPWSIDLDNQRLNCSRQLMSALGYPKQNMLTLSQLYAAFETQQLQLLKQHIAEVRETGIGLNQTTVINTYKHRYIAEIMICDMPKNGSMVKGSIQFTQYFLTKQQELEFLKKLFSKSSEAFMIADANHSILIVNQAFCDVTGYAEHELLGKPASILKSGRYTFSFYEKLWQYVDEHKIWFGERLAKTKQGEIFAHEGRIQRIDLEDSSHVYVSASHKLDVSTHMWQHDNLEEVSKVHIPDKQSFISLLDESFKQLSHDMTIICITFDLQMLQTLSKLTQHWLISQRFARLTFTGHLGLVNESMYAAYFVVSKQVEPIDQTLKKVIFVLEGNDESNNMGLSANITAGVSVLYIDAKSPTQLLSHSVQALIANSRLAKSSLYYFDRRLTKRFDRKNTLATLLKQALAKKNIAVYYQPIVDISELKIVKFEALFRAQLETDINYSTQELIEIAEEFNWIDKIDDLVTTQALKVLPLLQKHYANDQIGLSINRSVNNDRIAHCCLEDTLKILEQSKVDLNLVTLELTESAYFEDSNYHAKWINKLKAHGVSIALDDFGTGFSSLSYLRQLPVSIVKIDRSFVSGLTKQSNEYEMINMLCRLTHKIGGKIIAEGAETEQELHLLSSLGVDMIQGYIFDKPKSLQDILSTPTHGTFLQFQTLLSRANAENAQAIMRRDFPKISTDDKLKKALESFTKHKVKQLIVIEHSQCRGILHICDVNAAISPYLNTKGEQHRDLVTLNKRVHQVMSKNFLEVSMDTPVKHFYPKLIEDPDMVVVVVGSSGVCVGVIALKDILIQQSEILTCI